MATRRDFLQACGAVALGGFVPIPESHRVVKVTQMGLYEVTDKFMTGCLWDEAIWMPVWARSPEKAEHFFMDRYKHAAYVQGNVATARMVDKWWYENPPDAYQETDEHKLREIGWRKVFDHQCDCCGLYEMGVKPVCDQCHYCEDCATPDCEGCDHEELQDVPKVQAVSIR